MISLDLFINSLILGCLLGGLYAIMGLGLALSVGVMKIVNLAHGDFIVGSSYLAFVLLTSFGVDPMFSLVFCVPFMFGLGFIIQRCALERAFKIDPNAPILITFGISIILQNIYLLVWTPYSKGLVTGYATISIKLESFNIPLVYLLDFLAALAVAALIRIFLKKTYLGIAIRASSQNWRAARLIGIDTDRVRAFAFGLALALSAFSGVFTGLTLPFTPTSGMNYLLVAFGVLMIGGLGMLGSFIGGVIMGLANVLTGVFVGVGWPLFTTSIIILLALYLRAERILGGGK